MTAAHNDIMMYLALQLGQQLNREDFRVRSNAGHVRRSAENYYIPDVFVVPTALVRPLLPTHRLETYAVPLPLVVEVWSPSTGDYDVKTKLLEYQRRGDLEIWLIHPFERTLTAWRRQPDATYSETVFEGGRVQPVALPDVTVDLDALFA
jgi:Uma2 family endonuclease